MCKTKPYLRGFNSFIADEPHEDFQLELMFLSDLKDPVYSTRLLMVDIFNKYCKEIPIKKNQSNEQNQHNQNQTNQRNEAKPTKPKPIEPKE